MKNANNDPEIQAFKRIVSTQKNIAENIAAQCTIPRREPAFADFPQELHPALITYCKQIHIEQLYSHQNEALRNILTGKNVVLSTATSSGKSLVFQLAIYQGMLNDPEMTALLLYPTKALANDQVKPFHEMQLFLQNDLTVGTGKAAIYDGDTPKEERISIRNTASILLTNPDMLHLSLLPHHPMWKRFFANLRYVVIDEIHIYKGVFGSHFANVLRRLDRIVRYYGGDPIYICNSATIHDPLQFAEQLVEKPFIEINQDGSGAAEKDIYFYNPPLVDQELGIRKGILEEGIKLTAESLGLGIQTLLFVRTRRSVEIFLRKAKDSPGITKIHGYRSGYLASERREIENGLKKRDILCVVATNALELGIDIGGIDCVMMLGYPGTIASFLQQMGRAGRKNSRSTAFFIASADPLDQFLLQNPAYVLENTPEQPLINAQNLLILFNQLRCAAYELPFSSGDTFGKLAAEQLKNFLEVLQSAGDLVEKDGKFFWIGEGYPSASISIRTISAEPFDLFHNDNGKLKRIGEVDGQSALWMVHPGAIYMHAGETYHVDELRLEEHKAILTKDEFPYYTNPKQHLEIDILSRSETAEKKKALFTTGNVLVSSQVVAYDKLDWSSNEVLQTIDLDLPPTVLDTQSFWIQFTQETIETLQRKSLWMSDLNDYGDQWEHIRTSILQRDGYRCSLCGLQPDNSGALHVHHKVPFRTFTDKKAANHPSNLITLCEKCHHRVEQTVRIRSSLSGLGYLFSHLAPLYLMCDLHDLGVFIEPRWKPIGNMPVILLYDNFPGGIGLSETLFQKYPTILQNAQDVIRNCNCFTGCPSCVGPVNNEFFDPKGATLALLQEILY
ncbi:MAG TPA: ATP-dependent helicase [Anaerolineaceae bacterium]|uniref:Putative ATP-dependent helicase n=1 Tax=Anaerolinea thermophila TaxID=167964 RepID=A0A117LH56_9CHLR|nr:MAG: Putative ATP-dependent helicase [Anaerolinea thermophila]HAF61257.1 ATP-dependent helicase [Anaerolineaceae bacterium]